MSTINGIGNVGHITLSFHAARVVGYEPTPVTVPDLVSALDAVQKAIYTVAAHDRHLPSIRNLRDDERRHYTLTLRGIHANNDDPSFELVPLSAFPRETAPTLFPADEMARITRDSACEVVAAAVQATRSLATHFGESRYSQLSPLAPQLSLSAVTLATVALRSGQTICLRVTDTAHQVELEADDETSFQVLARVAVEHGELERHPDCVVRDVLTSQPVFHVEVPDYGDALVRCEYRGGPASPGDEYARSLHAGDSVTILGAPRWVRGQGRSGPPDVIEVAALLDDGGHPIGHPILDLLLKETANELLAP